MYKSYAYFNHIYVIYMCLSHHRSPLYVCVHAKPLKLCLTLCDSMECSQPDRSVHGNSSPGKHTGVGCHALLQEIFLTQGLNLHLLCLPHWRAGSLPLVPPGKPLYVFIYIIYLLILNIHIAYAYVSVCRQIKD